MIKDIIQWILSFIFPFKHNIEYISGDNFRSDENKVWMGNVKNSTLPPHQSHKVTKSTKLHK